MRFVLPLLTALLFSSQALAAGAMFVMIQSADAPACGKSGKITGTVSVKAGAGGDYETVDTLKAGTVVSVCDGNNGWYGIVYSHSNLNCETKGAMRKGPYAGPCRTGWVPTSAVSG